jgi:F420-0:gamma-glutamyl ligase-like protein
MFKPNKDKNIEIDVDGKMYQRFPIKTHIISDKDDIIKVIKRYTNEHLQKDDKIFISEKIVAISQGRAFPIDEIKPSWWANTLSKFVHKSKYGIGLGSPWTMQLAIKEAGLARMLFSAAISGVTKLFGFKGVFYKVVGKNINAIDGPCDYTLPPYNKYAKLGPKNPDKVARKISQAVGGNEIVIIDANDLGVEILGRSTSSLDKEFCKKAFKDNPLGQTTEQTPVCIVRLKGKE